MIFPYDSALFTVKIMHNLVVTGVQINLGWNQAFFDIKSKFNYYIRLTFLREVNITAQNHALQKLLALKIISKLNLK